MKILVTGGSGFIGSRLVKNLLNSGHKVCIYDKVKRKKFPDLSIIGNVIDKDQLTNACKDIDVIYHLAAEHQDNVTPLSLYSDVNIGGAENVIYSAEQNNIKKIIFTSTVAIYGLNKGAPDESTSADPFNEYGRTKLEAEKLFIKWQKSDEKQNTLVMLRPAVVFGEENRGNVYNLMKQISTGKFVMIGSGKNYKSMGYVGNIAAFLEYCLVYDKGINIYNFADKPDLTSNEIVSVIKKELEIKKNFIRIPYAVGLLGGFTLDILSKITGKKFPVSYIRIKKFCATTQITTEKLLNSEFNAPFTIEDGLKKMIKNDFNIKS